MSFRKKNVCLSDCLALSESADARDLGLMTLFNSFSAFLKKMFGENSLNKRPCCSVSILREGNSFDE